MFAGNRPVGDVVVDDGGPFVNADRIIAADEPTKHMGDGLGDKLMPDITATDIAPVEDQQSSTGETPPDDEVEESQPYRDQQAQVSVDATYSQPISMAGESGEATVLVCGEMDRRTAQVATLTVKKAIAIHGRTATESIKKEMAQMLEKLVFEGVFQDKLTPQEIKSIIHSYLFVTEKYFPDGSFNVLKARLVAAGDQQDKELYDNVSSPTASLSSLLIVAGLAAKEGREVLTVDVAGAYLNADITGVPVLMRLDKYNSSILVGLDPTFAKYVNPKTGCIVVRLKKALYGCVESALLWYQHLKGTLMELGYTPNPLDPCVFNKGEGLDQCTVVVYVDDLFITSKSSVHVDGLLAGLKEAYKTIKVHRGKVLPYVGMLFDYSVAGQVAITMEGYILDCLRMARTVGRATTPATAQLFEIDENSSLLTSEDKQYFHSAVAKLYYLAKRVRPDLLTALSFLVTRTTAPTLQDFGKLTRVFNYLAASKGFGIVLRPGEGDVQVKGYVDASYATHPNAKSHTGVIIFLGSGPVYVRSTKQTLVTKSSAESELVALSEGVTYVIWSREFLQHQGYKMGPGLVYQDNQATMAMAKRGPTSSGNSRHINIRYYFITDRIASNEIELEYLPTKDMVADLLTKPLQGADFRRQRTALLNWRY